MKNLSIDNLSGSSLYVVKHFITNKLQSTVFKNDTKQAAKLAGIQDAINKGFLYTGEIPLTKDIRVSASSDLMDLYFKKK
jgi:hypothetical protein